MGRRPGGADAAEDGEGEEAEVQMPGGGEQPEARDIPIAAAPPEA